VDGRCRGRNQSIEFTESICHGVAVEARGEFTGVRIDSVDIADVAIVDGLVVVEETLNTVYSRIIGTMRSAFSSSGLRLSFTVSRFTK
jgi:hypothetical protein